LSSGEVFAPGALISGPGLDGGIQTLSGTSMAAPEVAGLAALAQQIALQKLGRTLTAGEFRQLLASTSRNIFDGDDENDNVHHTGLVFPSVDGFALANAIVALSPGSPPDGDGGSTPPVSSQTGGFSTVTLTDTQIVTGMDFGNFHLGTISGRV